MTAATEGPGILTVRRELGRKAIHLLSSAIPLAYALGVGRSGLIAVLGAAVIIAVGIEIYRRRSDRGRRMFDARFGALLRPHEFLGLSGATWLVVSFLLAVVLYPPAIAITAMLAVSLGDAAAAIIGRTVGGLRAVAGKTTAGSLACFVVTTLATFFVARLSLSEAILAGALAAIAERPRRPMDDNLRIAIVVGCGILLWRMGFS